MLTEEALTDHDLGRVSELARLHDPEPVRAHVLVPVDPRHNRLIEALDDLALGQFREALTGDPSKRPAEEARVAAENAVTEAVSGLRTTGLEAEGEVLHGDPVRGTIERFRALDADEVIVVTEPHLVEEALHRDWASRIRSALDKPVLHAVAGTDRVL